MQNRYSGSGRGMQRLVIGELTDIELLEASGQSPDLLALLENGSTPLFNLLRNPFNLHLAFALLSDGISLAELRTVQSQVQLLESYWRYRVQSPLEGSLREKLLTTVTPRWSIQRTCRFGVGGRGAGLPTGFALTEELRSAPEVQPGGSRMSNVLFDLRDLAPAVG